MPAKMTKKRITKRNYKRYSARPAVYPMYKTLTPLRHTATPRIVPLKVSGSF